MKSSILVSLLSLTLFSTIASADLGLPKDPNNNCVAKSEMQAIASNFRQFANLANADYCYDGSQTSHLIASIMFMRQTAFTPVMNPSPDELFSGRFASSWYNYFIGRINKLEIVNSCPKGVVAYVYSFGGKTMYACHLALTDAFSSLDRASVFMHEARHIDGFPHVTCSKGPRQGLQGACDTRIADGGSYGVTVETYAQLGKYAVDLHPALRAYAKSAAVIYADEAFENPVRIQRQENLLMLSANLDFHLMNISANSIRQLGRAPASGHIVKRAQHLTFFPDDKNLKAEYIFARNEGTITQSPGDAFTEYNEQTPAQRAEFVDFHSGTQWNARVYKTYARMTCDPTSASTTDLKFPAGTEAAGMLYPNGYDRGQYTAHLSMKDGSMFEIGCKSRRAFMEPSNLKFEQKFKRMYKVASTIYALSFDGQVYRIDGGRTSLVPLNFSVSEIAPQQLFDFYEN